jgi:hypothetical protein
MMVSEETVNKFYLNELQAYQEDKDKASQVKKRKLSELMQ